MISNVLSHRIVGPIFAIKRSLEMIEKDNLSEARIQLRSDDEFHEVAESINRVIDKLSK
ncbi:MAG: HAMP domain-containing protein [Bdellovibrionota bacterium]